MGYTVRWATNTAKWGAAPSQAQYIARWFRWNDRGGPSAAEVTMTGPEHLLWSPIFWLTRPFTLYNDAQQPVWWGVLNEVVLHFGVLDIRVSMDWVANRVKVAYSKRNADGTYSSLQTAWATNDESIAKLGTKEAIWSAGRSDDTAALAERDRVVALLGKLSAVQAFANASDTELSCSLLGIGLWETLDWKLFARSDGVFSTPGDLDESQAIGWSVAGSNLIGFSPAALHDLDARLDAIQVGDQIVVTGSSSNNGTLTCAALASGDKITYTNTGISFTANDKIDDTALGLGFVRSGYLLKVSGSASNSRTHRVQYGGNQIDLDEAYNGNLATEAAGPSVTLKQGARLDLVSGGTDEAPSASITLKLVGYEIYQTFTLSAAMLVDRISIGVGSVGSPADNLEIRIVSDSSGTPGTLLQSTTIAPGSMTNRVAWLEVDIPNLTSLNTSTTYGLHIRRTGSLDALNYFEIAMNAVGTTVAKAWNGSAWVSHPRSLSLPMRLSGAEDTITQINRIISDCGQYFAGTDLLQSSSGRQTNQYREGDNSGLYEANKLLDLGTSSGQRLIALVTQDSIVRLAAQPDISTAMLDQVNPRTGKLVGRAGNELDEGILPVGRWVRLVGVPDYVNDMLRISPMYVAGAEWDCIENRLSDLVGVDQA